MVASSRPRPETDPVAPTPDGRLGRHVLEAAFVASRTARKLGLANELTPKARARARYLAQKVLDPLIDAVGPIKIDSGYRSPAVNAAIPGSSNTSDHMNGGSADIMSDKVSRDELARKVIELGLPYDQLIGYADKPHLHIGTRPGRNRGQRLWYPSGSKNAVEWVIPGIAGAVGGAFDPPDDVRDRIVRQTSRWETAGGDVSKITPASLNKNTDGRGLSFGILNWNQGSGGMYEPLVLFWQSAPARFGLHFGPSYRTLLEAVRSKSLAPVDGEVLWGPKWVARFLAAASDPALVALQWTSAKYGSYMKTALEQAERAGLTSERSIALLFDRAVQQGPGTVRKAVTELLKALPSGTEGAARSWLADWFIARAPSSYRSDVKKRVDAVLSTSLVRDASVTGGGSV